MNKENLLDNATNTQENILSFRVMSITNAKIN